MNLQLSAVFLFVLLSVPAWGAPGSMIKNDELRLSASSSAASGGRVEKGASVEILARKGGWTQIKHADKTGWVRVLSVKSTASSSGNTLGGIVQLGTEQRDPRRVVAVAGVRGLNEEELRGARFNAKELMRMDQFVSSRADAESFARGAGLRSVDLAYIEAAKGRSESKSNHDSNANVWGETSW